MNENAATQTITASQTTAAASTPTVGEMIFNVGIFAASLIPAIAIAYYLFTDPTRLADAWSWIRALPVVVQLVLWALLLPWMLALWVFSTPWPFLVRFALVLGIVLFGEYLMFPWKP